MQGVQTTDGDMHAPPEVASRLAALPPLIKAAMDGNEALVRQLVAAGADIAQPNQVGLTCAHFAAKNGHIGMLRLVVRSARSLCCGVDIQLAFRLSWEV